MSRFSAPIQPKAGSRPVQNDAGGNAFDREPKSALASLVLTSMVQDSFYKSAGEHVEEVKALVRKIAAAGDLKYVAKAALYARNEHGLRSISHVLAAEVAQVRTDVPLQRGAWGPDFFKRIVYRPDDMGEIAGYWISNYGKGEKKTLPAAMKRGFAKVLEKLSEHALSKYDGSSTRSLTLRQLAHLCHPKGGKESVIYKLRAGTLAPADTHEVAFTKAGQAETDKDDATVKAEVWGDLFKRGKVGYFAALRNARRIANDAPECAEALCALLTNPEEVKKCKVLPFQFLTAREAMGVVTGPVARRIIEAIETAGDLALANVPSFDGATLICLDDSGSMTSSPNGKTSPVLIGSMFAVALARATPDCDVMLFDESARYVQISQRSTLFDGMARLQKDFHGGGTDFNAPFRAMKRIYDRIVFLSDMQGWVGGGAPTATFEAYKRNLMANPRIYSWDLVGSSTTQFPAPRISAMAGISDKVFDVMKMLEQDPKAMVAAIEAVVL